MQITINGDKLPISVIIQHGTTRLVNQETNETLCFHVFDSNKQMHKLDTTTSEMYEQVKFALDFVTQI